MNSNFIEKIFGKTNHEISLNDIKEYFTTPQEESSILEFKSGEVEINDVFKEITAFLNTEGGLLIIGAPRETKQIVGKNTIKICQGEITYSNFKNKDWLYQKIASNIVPFPENLKIVEFLTENGNAFLIDIPQSINPPHQCSSDGKYYLRLERDAKPAPHGIIQALFNKRRMPKLNVELKLQKLNQFNDNVLLSIKNENSIPAEKVSYIVDIYNIQGVDSLLNFNVMDDTLGKKFTMSNNIQHVLVQVINHPINLNINHKLKEYIVFVGYWSKDTDFDFKYFTISPIEKNITNIGTMSEGELLLEELVRLQE